MNLHLKRSAALLVVAALLGTSIVSCASKGQTGAVIGGASGAAIGGQFGGRPQDRLLGAGIGLILGSLAGYAIGNELDKRDQQEVARTLEYTPSGQTSTWHNPDNGNYYAATPEPAYRYDNRECRDITIAADTNNDGRFDDKVKSRACREPDGTWRMSN